MLMPPAMVSVDALEPIVALEPSVIGPLSVLAPLLRIAPPAPAPSLLMVIASATAIPPAT